MPTPESTRIQAAAWDDLDLQTAQEIAEHEAWLDDYRERREAWLLDNWDVAEERRLSTYHLRESGAARELPR